MIRFRSRSLAPVDAKPIVVEKKKRRLHFYFKIAIVVSFLIAQEVALRILFPLPAIVGFNRVDYQFFEREHPRFLDIMKRGLVYDKILFESEPDGYSEVHRLNQFGFRGDDFSLERPKGQRRMLVIGDSVTEGQGAPESATISAELERLFSRRGEKVEVLNFGVVAATLNQITPLARDAINLFHPTDVTLVLFANDLPAPAYSLSLNQRFQPRKLEQQSWWLPWISVLGKRLIRKEPIYNRLPKPALRFFAPVPDSTNPFSKVNSTPKGVDPVLFKAMAAGRINPWLVQQTKLLPDMLSHDFAHDGGAPTFFLNRVADACMFNNANLLIAYVPFCGVANSRYAAAQIKMGMPKDIANSLASDPIYQRQNAMLADICKKLQLPLADATKALIQAEASGVLQFWEYDTHPRPAGYATIAREIFEVWNKKFTPDYKVQASSEPDTSHHPRF